MKQLPTLILDLVLFSVVVLMFAWLLFDSAQAAPVPEVKVKPAVIVRVVDPPSAKALVGKWKMIWKDIPCNYEFYADGQINGIYAGSPWHGEWKFDDKTNILTVGEMLSNGGTGVITWEVRMKTSHTGKHVDDDVHGPFQLLSPPPDF